MLKGFGEIRLLNRDEISIEKWEQLVSQSSNSIFLSHWYLDAVMGNWQAYILNDYELAFPISKSKKLHFNYSLQPLFLRAFSVLGKSDDKKKEFIELILKDFHFCELNFTLDSVDFIHQTTQKSNYQFLDFNTDLLQIQKKYSENTRRKLKDFTKSKAQFVELKDVDVLINLFQKEKGNQFEHLTTDAYYRLRKLMHSALAYNSGIIKAIEFENELVAIGFFIKKERNLLYLKGIVTGKGKKLGAMQALFDSVIQENYGHVDGLDFGGSSDEGLASFNKKFGATDRKYLILKQNNMPWPLNKLVGRKLNL